MKIALGICIAMTALLQAGELEFKELLQEAHAPAGVKSVTADFEFTNRSGKPVKVSKHESGCSCVSVSIKEGKLEYQPGESGLIRATFDVGNFSGVVDKHIALWLDDAPIEQPSVRLTVRVNIPVLVEMEPKTLKWDVGEKLGPKTIRITMKHDKPIRIVKVETSNDAFKFENKTVEEGKSYDLVITPADTTTPGICIFRVETDCDIEKFKVQQAFGVVRRPLPTDTAAKP